MFGRSRRRVENCCQYSLTRVKAALVGSIFRLLTALTVARAMEADMLKLLKHFVLGCKHQR